MHVRLAHTNDLTRLLEIINSVYRGEDSKKNWTTEAHWIEGLRIQLPELQHYLDNKTFTLLVLEEGNVLLGCVKLEIEDDGRVFLGLLTVSGDKQKVGLGKFLVRAAEKYTLEKLGCNDLHMMVLSNRPELLAWYERQGYQDTSQRRPWLESWGPTTVPLEFKIMRKGLNV